jgi:hypothetical protein
MKYIITFKDLLKLTFLRLVREKTKYFRNRKKYPRVPKVPCFVCNMKIDVDKWEDHYNSKKHQKNMLDPIKIAECLEKVTKKLCKKGREGE